MLKSRTVVFAAIVISTFISESAAAECGCVAAAKAAPCEQRTLATESVPQVAFVPEPLPVWRGSTAGGMDMSPITCWGCNDSGSSLPLGIVAAALFGLTRKLLRRGNALIVLRLDQLSGALAIAECAPIPIAAPRLQHSKPENRRGVELGSCALAV
jgi:hypothetical protein